LQHLFLALGILSDDPKSDADDKVRSYLGEGLADVCENSGTVFWVNFDYFPDKEDSLKGGEGRLALKLEE